MVGNIQIEERAREYAGTPLPTSKVRELRVIDYTKGASEQKAIDDAEKEQLILKAKSIVKEMFSFTAGLTSENISKEFETKLRNTEYGKN